MVFCFDVCFVEKESVACVQSRLEVFGLCVCVFCREGVTAVVLRACIRDGVVHVSKYVLYVTCTKGSDWCCVIYVRILFLLSNISSAHYACGTV